MKQKNFTSAEEKRKYYEKKQKKEMAQMLLEMGCSKKDTVILLSELYKLPEEKAEKFVTNDTAAL